MEEVSHESPPEEINLHLVPDGVRTEAFDSVLVEKKRIARLGRS